MNDEHMTAYKISCRNLLNDTEYADSYWLRKPDAEARVQAIKDADALETEPHDHWRYTIHKIHINL